MTSHRPAHALLRLAAPLVALGVVLPAVPAEAQDVELLGRIHGTRPPASYYRVMRADPRAFRFDQVWERRVPAIRELRHGPRGGSEGDGEDGSLGIQESTSTGFWPGGDLAGGRAPASGGSGSTSTSSSTLGERSPVTGEFAVPMVLGLFDDTGTTPFRRDRIHEEFWIGPNTRGMTIPDFYAEISGGQLDMVGATFDWVRTGLTQSEVTAGESGLPGEVGEFIVQILEGIEAGGTVDWGRFDNDGPDGMPNTTDDDGYVDVLTVVHPTAGAECNESADRIWSHKWTLEGAYGSAYETDTPSASGGNIRINSYTIQPTYSCDQTTINEIGVFAHELGHGFGLPDLYGVGAQHNGIGNWGLMGTGSWGCDGRSPERPCHMSAWSKAMLGWVDVVDVPGGSDVGTLALDPVESSRTVYRAVAGSGVDEYFLLENRQRIGSDANLFAPGLLVWHVDDEVLRSWWSSNQVNSDPDHMGVWLRQADGLNDLARRGGGRGDPGDPFPGSTGNTAYHVSTVPSSRDHAGVSTGITVTEIATSGDRISLDLSTRYRILTFRTEGTSGSGGMVTVDGTTSSGTEDTVTSSPFQVHQVEAAPGHEVSAGTRIGFLAWSDGGERVHDVTTGWADSTLTASYAGTEHLLDLSTDGPVPDVAPGTFELTPSSADHWFDEGVEVVVDARARTGFRFTGWSGDWSGDLNPTSVVMDAPGAATAHFEQAFEVAGSVAVAFEAGVAQEIVLEATDGNEPVVWELVEGTLPEGMSLAPGGVIRGAALEVGTFTVTLRAVDALGLQAVSPPVELEAITPVIGTDALASGFFLEEQALTSDQREFLDRQGNGNGLYDLGDFRAFVLANPDLPASADTATPAPVTVRLEMGLTADPGPRRDETPKREEEP